MPVLTKVLIMTGSGAGFVIDAELADGYLIVPVVEEDAHCVAGQGGETVDFDAASGGGVAAVDVFPLAVVEILDGIVFDVALRVFGYYDGIECAATVEHDCEARVLDFFV